MIYPHVPLILINHIPIEPCCTYHEWIVLRKHLQETMHFPIKIMVFSIVFHGFPIKCLLNQSIDIKSHYGLILVPQLESQYHHIPLFRWLPSGNLTY